MVPRITYSSAPCRRFPRTRGDGPYLGPGRYKSESVPPHPRGWSAARRAASCALAGSPAPAGMVPVLPPSMHPDCRFPRTRGDGPFFNDSRFYPLTVPPHPRGWSPGRRLRDRSRDGSPAPAGMVPRSLARPRGSIRFPRTRGDGPAYGFGTLSIVGVPPHPRGWSRRNDGERARRSGSPAPAGMVPGQRVVSRCHRRFPRTRGDGPRRSGGAPTASPVPPHPRGWSLNRRVGLPARCGSPAPAGMVPRGKESRTRRGGFPRTRGDGPVTPAAAMSSGTVPPHPRGWSRPMAPEGRVGRGSPAPAGMVPRWR